MGEPLLCYRKSHARSLAFPAKGSLVAEPRKISPLGANLQTALWHFSVSEQKAEQTEIAVSKCRSTMIVCGLPQVASNVSAN